MGTIAYAPPFLFPLLWWIFADSCSSPAKIDGDGEGPHISALEEEGGGVAE